MRILFQVHRFLNNRRRNYALIAGAAMWFGWLTSILMGPGNRDLLGQLIGADFLAFYTGGEILLKGQSEVLYDLDFQQALQKELIGNDWGDLEAFVNPPFYAWLSVPLARLPYVSSFVLWALLSLLALWISLCLLDIKKPRRPYVWSLTWFPVFATISFGQNSLMSLLLFCLAFRLWRTERLWLAGLVSSLLLFKPQWIIGLGILWLLEWRRNTFALLGLALGGVGLGILSFWSLPDASLAYLDLTRNVLPTWQNQAGYQLHHLHTVRGFWLLLLPQCPDWADLLALISAVAGLIGFVFFWRRYRDRPKLLFAGTICLTLWLSPHAMIYDWAILLIPAVLLWQEEPNLISGWTVLYAVIWVVTFLSSPLTFAQLQHLPFAVQISVPTFLLVVSIAHLWLLHPQRAINALAGAVDSRK